MVRVRHAVLLSGGRINYLVLSTLCQCDAREVPDFDTAVIARRYPIVGTTRPCVKAFNTICVGCYLYQQLAGGDVPNSQLTVLAACRSSGAVCTSKCGTC